MAILYFFDTRSFYFLCHIVVLFLYLSNKSVLWTSIYLYWQNSLVFSKPVGQSSNHHLQKFAKLVKHLEKLLVNQLLYQTVQCKVQKPIAKFSYLISLFYLIYLILPKFHLSYAPVNFNFS